jgi:hypothetical protein
MPPIAEALPLLVAGAALAIVLGGRWSTIAHPEVAVASAGFETDDLYAWARTSTPVDAQFLTPPSLSAFRLLARRAIVVDLKSPPLVPDELVEWYRRLCRVTGEPRLHDVPQAIARWNASTEAQLRARARTLGATYVVLDRPHEVPNPPGSIYANDRYVVYATQP